MNTPTNTATSTASNPSATMQKNLLDTAAANGTFKTFGKAVEAAGMTDTLRGTGPFTVFAPTDAAFAKLPAGKLDNLLKPENKSELVSLLNYHVISGRKSAADLGKWKEARMVSGVSAPIELKGESLRIAGATVTTADIDTSNGVIHGIDQVNLPAPTRQ